MKNSTLKTLKLKYNLFKGLYNFNHRRTILDNSPLIICLEVTNACNLRCRICPMNTGIVKRKKTFMKKSLFKTIVDECHEYMDIVGISHHGESLLHQDLPYFISHLHKYGVKSLITTNATLLDENKSKIILKSNLDYIMFSFDSLKKDVYENIRVGANFEKTLDNIIKFLELKSKMNKSTHVCIRTINMDSTKNDIQEFVSYFGKLQGIDEIEMNEINTWAGRIDRSNFIRNQLMGIRKVAFCLQPWTTAIINSEGGIFVCNNHEDEDFGNLKEHNLKEIWNNEQYRNLRKKILQSRLDGTICQNCDYESIGMYYENPNIFFPFTKKYLSSVLNAYKNRFIKRKIRSFTASLV